jgi:hypothetical protein
MRVPKFEDEAQEAQWWYENREAVEDALIDAIDRGTIHRGVPAALLRDTRAIQVRIPHAEIERLEKVADRWDFNSIQDCINALLREALVREEEQERRKAG